MEFELECCEAGAKVAATRQADQLSIGLAQGRALEPSSRTSAPMSRQLAVAVFLLLCLAPKARAWPPWQERPVISTTAFTDRENPASRQDKTIGSTADYVQTLDRALIISGIGVSVRDGRARLIDGHHVSGAEVIDVPAGGPAALAGIQPASMAAKVTLLEAGAVFAILLTPAIPLLQAIDHSSMLDNSDVILPRMAKESETLLTLWRGFRVLRAAIEYISRLPDEGGEFKSV
jgi:hypothetical protein